MIYQFIKLVEQGMSDFLLPDQMTKLHEVLVHSLSDVQTTGSMNDHQLIDSFITAKRIEGCSPKTLKYYSSTLTNVFSALGKDLSDIGTNDLRDYLSEYQMTHNVSKTTINNVRRILSSFYSWLEEEDHIFRSPIRRIKKVKTSKLVKDVFSDEDLEVLRDGCDDIRDLAMVDLLISTGIRVGELVNLDIDDVDLENRECVVLGKGDKERIAYFDARTKIHLSKYLEQRVDDNQALFVSQLSPHDRLNISGVESLLRHLGNSTGIDHVHPHKFRRTFATRAIDKGMPIEQVQQLLGHTKIDTTMEYVIVNQSNVKMSHRRFIS